MLPYNAILLIDDDEEDQEIFKDALTVVDPQLHCSFANDGEEALELLDGGALLKPDLIFIDLNMPKLNGKQVLQALKHSGALRDVPVVMYSTFFGPKDIAEINALGAAHYMVKATRFDELCASLKKNPGDALVGQICSNVTKAGQCSGLRQVDWIIGLQRPFAFQ